jgi:hypothetical protein
MYSDHQVRDYALVSVATSVCKLSRIQFVGFGRENICMHGQGLSDLDNSRKFNPSSETANDRRVPSFHQNCAESTEKL